MRVIKSPQRMTRRLSDGSIVFLAGSIEQGKAENWQAVAESMLEGTSLVVYNPRREDWNPEWVAGSKELIDQIKWERKGLKKAEYKLFYFDPTTTSPITLLELGEFGSIYPHVVVVCPNGYYRKTNVEIFCEDNEIELFNTLEEGIEHLKQLIEDEY